MLLKLMWLWQQMHEGQTTSTQAVRSQTQRDNELPSVQAPAQCSYSCEPCAYLWKSQHRCVQHGANFKMLCMTAGFQVETSLLWMPSLSPLQLTPVTSCHPALCINSSPMAQPTTPHKDIILCAACIATSNRQAMVHLPLHMPQILQPSACTHAVTAS